MHSQIAQRCRKKFHGGNKGKSTASFLNNKNNFFHDTASKTGTTCVMLIPCCAWSASNRN